jgi:DNA-binding MarR family transcriptional regulator
VPEPGEDFDIEGLDEVIHGRLRLGVMAYLSTAQEADFNTLKAKLQATDGNLSAHLRKLEEAGYVRIDKSFIGRKPATNVVLTNAGSAAFVGYLDAIGRLVDQGRG